MVILLVGVIYLLVMGKDILPWTQESKDQQLRMGDRAEVQQLTLLNVDRQLRASDALADKSAWVRWLFFTTNPGTIREDVLKALDTAEPALDAHGRAVYAIILASGGEMEKAKQMAPSPSAGPEAALVTSWLEGRRPTRGQMMWLRWRISENIAGWWDVELAKGIESRFGMHELQEAIAYQSANNKLTLYRSLAPQLVNWVFAICGVVFIPQAFRMLRNGLHQKAEGYLSHISVNQGVTVFMVGDLAAMGLMVLTYTLLGTISSGWPLGVDMLIDTIWRLMPAVIGMAWFFARYQHVHRAYHFETPLPWSALLGLFSILWVADLILHPMLEPLLPVDPTGGLDPMEQGWDGLAYGLVSACVVAPIGEEFLYRGILFRSLGNKLGTLAAAGISTLVFAVAHNYDAYGFISVALFGFCMALLYQSTRSLAVPILFHAFYNFSVTVPNWVLYFAP